MLRARAMLFINGYVSVFFGANLLWPLRVLEVWISAGVLWYPWVPKQGKMDRAESAWCEQICSEGCSCALVPAKQGEQGGDKHFHHEQSRGLLGWLLVAAENFTNVDAEIDFFFFNRNVASYEVPKCTHFSKQFSLKLGICRCLKHACFSPVWVLNLKFVLQTKLWPVEPTKDNWETSRKTNPKGFKWQ